MELIALAMFQHRVRPKPILLSADVFHQIFLDSYLFRRDAARRYTIKILNLLAPQRGMLCVPTFTFLQKNRPNLLYSSACLPVYLFTCLPVYLFTSHLVTEYPITAKHLQWSALPPSPNANVHFLSFHLLCATH